MNVVAPQMSTRAKFKSNIQSYNCETAYCLREQVRGIVQNIQ